MLAALGSLDVLHTRDVYWAGRLTLCAGPDDLDRYDAAFTAYFAGERPRRGRSGPPEREIVSAMAPLDAGSGEGDGTPDVQELAVQASAAEVLRPREVAELTLTEREHLRRLFALLEPASPMRPARRRRPSPVGAVPPARTVRRALRD